MCQCHRVRMELVKHFACNNIPNASLMHKAVLVHARAGQVADAIRLAKNESLHVLQGIWEGHLRDTKKFLSDKVLRHVDAIALRSDDDASLLLRIYSVHGITDFGIQSGHIERFKKMASPTLAIYLIGALRRIKSERHFVWDLFRSHKFDDSALITEFMSTVCATNGWHDRVDSVIRPSLSLSAAAKCIRAFNHYPHGSEVAEQVWKIAAKNPLSPPIVDALIEFYAVNKQFGSVNHLLDLNLATSNAFGPIFRNLAPDNAYLFVFFKKFKRMQATTVSLQEAVCRAVINGAIAQRELTQLAHVLEWMHLHNVPLDPIMRSKVWAVELCPKRIADLIDMLDKKSAIPGINPFS